MFPASSGVIIAGRGGVPRQAVPPAAPPVINPALAGSNLIQQATANPLIVIGLIIGALALLKS